jgi:hypothetical protein
LLEVEREDLSPLLGEERGVVAELGRALGHQVLEVVAVDPQLLGQPPAVGHVADRARDPRPVVRFHRAQADLHPELREVVGSHVPDAGAPDVVGAAAHVARPEAVGNEQLDRLPQQLVARVAEELLGLAVDQDDLPLPVGDHHGVRGRLQEVLEAGLGPAPLGDVADHLGDEHAAGARERAQGDLDRELAAVPSPPECVQTRRWATCPAWRRSGRSISTVCPSSSSRP